MTLAVDNEDDAAFQRIYVPGVRGHCVLAMGADGEGRDALAVWQLGPTGRAGGAWVIRFDDMDRDADYLFRVISGQRGRGLVDWNSDSPALVLDSIAPHLPATLLQTLRASVVVIPDMLKEIAEHRQRYADAVEAYRPTTKSKIVALSWSEEVPGDPEMARQLLTPRRRLPASPVAADALGVTGALERAVDLWQDTEQVRYRRSYLRSFGQPQVLPPRWMEQLRAAMTG